MNKKVLRKLDVAAYHLARFKEMYSYFRDVIPYTQNDDATLQKLINQGIEYANQTFEETSSFKTKHYYKIKNWFDNNDIYIKIKKREGTSVIVDMVMIADNGACVGFINDKMYLDNGRENEEITKAEFNTYFKKCVKKYNENY